MKKGIVLLVILVLSTLIFVGWWSNGFGAPDPDNSEKISFVVAPGEAVRSIGSNLKDQGLIKDPTIFFLYLKKEGIDTGLQAGSYVLSPSMTLTEIVDAMRSGSIDVWVRIPEGARAEEVIEILANTLPNYDNSWDSALLAKEGRLFPDSYLIPKDAQVEDVIRITDSNLNTRLESIGLSANTPGLNRILTIASLIEREAKLPEDRALVAGVIENRLEIGMPLQIDASAQYVVGTSGNWWGIPTPEDLLVESPYNTYIISGLPPGPIASPGIASIQAAANPESSSYLYYVNDDTGKLRYSTTYEEHLDAIERYLQ